MDAMAEALSALRWWQEAGVDTLADDTPRNWLVADTARPAVVSAPEPTALPETLEALRAWLADPANLPELGGARFATEGDPAGGLMLLVEMPEREDMAAGRLLADAAGRLLDRMLAAIGRDRTSVYLAAIAPARPVGGKLAPAAAELLRRVAARHVALAAPRAVMLLGQGAAQAFGLAWPHQAGRLQKINHDRGSVAAIAACHPCFLLKQPAYKAEAWRDLRALNEELGR